MKYEEAVRIGSAGIKLKVVDIFRASEIIKGYFPNKDIEDIANDIVKEREKQHDGK